MPELRWILTAIGIALIVGVYVWSRRERTDDSGDLDRREPGLGGRAGPWDESQPVDELLPELNLDELSGPGPRSGEPSLSGDAADSAAEPLGHGEQLIVALRLRARQPEGFDGTDLVKAFSAESLEFGRFGAFHSLDERRRSRFLVASLVEPGSFEIDKMHELRCPGVSMFMVLPGPREPLSALEAMFGCARRLAQRLDAELLDDKGNALTMQQASWLREQVVEFNRRSKLAAGTGAAAESP